MRRRTLVPAFSLLLLLGVGCTGRSPAVAPAPLQLEVPERWSATEVPEGEPGEGWWKKFDDPSLAVLVDEALRNNRDLRTAAVRLEAAWAEARIVGAERYPTLGAGLSGFRRRQNFIGLPIPGAEERVLSTTFTTLGVSLSTQWEADLWGRVRSGEAGVLARGEALEADLRAARLSVAAQTTRLWFALMEADRQVELAERTVENYRDTLERVRLRFEAGLRPSIDLRLARSSLTAAEARVRQRKEIRERLVRQLEVLVGRYPEGLITPGTDVPELPSPVPAGLPAELVARRPDLQAAELRLAASRFAIEESRSNLYPRLSLTADGGTSTTQLRDLLNGDFGVWSLVANLVQPLFQGGRLRAGVELSEARSQEVLAAYASSVLQAYGEVETALAAEQILRGQEEDLRRAAVEATAALELAQTRYRTGLDEFLPVLESQRRLLEAETQLLSIRRRRIDARVDLYQALGGGFPPTSPANLVGTDDGESRPHSGK